jgi:hypothetical protein
MANGARNFPNSLRQKMKSEFIDSEFIPLHFGCSRLSLFYIGRNKNLGYVAYVFNQATMVAY